MSVSETAVDDADPCPSCGEAVLGGETPEGYRDEHCAACAHNIDRRRDWHERKTAWGVR